MNERVKIVLYVLLIAVMMFSAFTYALLRSPRLDGTYEAAKAQERAAYQGQLMLYKDTMDKKEVEALIKKYNFTEEEISYNKVWLEQLNEKND